MCYQRPESIYTNELAHRPESIVWKLLLANGLKKKTISKNLNLKNLKYEMPNI